MSEAQQPQSSEETSSSKPKKKGSALAHKRMSRLLAVQAVYQLMMSEASTDQALIYVRDPSALRVGLIEDGLDDAQCVDHDDLLLLSIVRKRDEHIDSLEEFLLQSSDQKYKTMDAVLRAILQCGAAEIFAHAEIDGPIIINDYLTITDSFYDGSEKKIVNAILDRLLKTVR